MVEQSSVFPLLAPCTSEDEFYQSGLNACIEGIKNFPVNKRQNTTGVCDTSNHISLSTRLTRSGRYPFHYKLVCQACSDLTYTCRAISLSSFASALTSPVT